MQKMNFFNASWYKFTLYFHNNLKIYVGTEPSKGAIWDEFREQHQHQIIKLISTIDNA